MKTKKILSFVLALAMIMAVVPSFGLVASAASAQTVIDALDATVLWNAPDGSYNDTAVASAWSGWSSSVTSGYVNVKSYDEGPTLQYYVNGTANVTNITSPGYGDGAEKIIIEWKHRGQTPSDLYFDFSFKDINGTEIAFLKLDKNFTAENTTNGNDFYALGYPNMGTDMAIVAYNNDDGTTHTVDYYQGGEKVATQASLSGKINGFKSIDSSNGRWSTAWNHIGFANLTIGAVMPATSKKVTATYTIDGTTVATAEKQYNTTEATGATFPAKYIYYNDQIYSAPEKTLSDSAEVAMTLYTTRYATFSEGDTISYEGKSYIVNGSSLVVNGDFITGDTSAWTNRGGSAITDASVAYDSEVQGNAMTISTAGASATNSIGTRWEVVSGKTYYLSFYVGGQKPTSGNYQYNRVFQSDGSTEIVAYGADMTDGAWKRFEKVFTATGDTILFQGSWASNIKYANVQLLPVEEDTSASADVTVNYYYDSDKTISFKNVTKSVVKGESVTFDAVSTTYEGKYYYADAATYSNVTEAASYDIVLTVDATKAVVVDDFSYNFNTGEVIWAGDNGYNSGDKTGTISIGWNNYRQTIMTFAIAPESGKMVTSAKLTVKVGFTNNDGAPYTVYAIDPKYVDYGNSTMKNAPTGKNWDNREDVKTALGAVQVGYHSWIPKGQTTTLDLDLSAVSSYLNTGVLALLIESGAQAYTDTAANGNAPYLSDITKVSAGTATIVYAGVEAENATYTYIESDALGYDDEKTFPNVPIASFDGYVFKNKTVDGNNIILTYIPVGTGDISKEWFFSNDESGVENSDTLVSLNMLGAHDAFTANIGEGSNKFDAAAIAQGDSGAKGALTAPSTAVPMSKAQSADALDMLNSGVRYFDIRLSRSSNTASYILKTAPHTNGVFYTTHGMLGEEFRPIAYTIGQWLKAHPGELVVLDFQEAYDYTDGHDGNADSATWTAINSILEESGINSYVRHSKGNASVKKVTYGDLTNNGESAGVVLWGRAVATNAGVGKFMLRHVGQDGTSGLFNGHLYSNYEPTDGTKIGSSFKTDYIQAQVDDMAVYANEDANGDHPIVWMQRVMQAQSESTNLLDQASSDHSALATALESNPTWLTALPIVMVNDAANVPDTLFSMIQGANTHANKTVEYYFEGTKVAEKSKVAMVGTLYTGDVANGIVSYDGTDLYIVETAPVTAPSNSANLVLVPSSGTITVNVAKLGSNVFTMQNGAIYTGSLFDSDTTHTGKNSFAAYNWGDEGTYDRMGVAILNLITDDDAIDNYILTGELYRHAQNKEGELNSVKFYAFSIDEFKNLDLSNTAAVYAALTEDRLVATGHTETGTETSQIKNAVYLDRDKVLGRGTVDGKVVIIGTSNNSLYGLADINYDDVGGNNWLVSYYKEPTATAQLGFDANGQFAIDFVFGNIGRGNVQASIYKEAALGGSSTPFIGNQILKATDEDKSLQVSTNDSNAIYKVIYKRAHGDIDADEKTIRASLYSVVIDAIISGQYDKDTNPLTASNLKKVNAILEKGGLYTDADGNLTAETAKIVKKNEDGTYSLTEAAQKAGIVMTLNDTTVQEVDVYMLEAVQLEFVPELIEETVVDEVVDIDSGSFEDIM